MKQLTVSLEGGPYTGASLYSLFVLNGFGERAGAKAGTSSVFPQDMLVATVSVGGRTGVREVAARAGCNPVLLLCSVYISPCGPKFWSRSSKGVGFLLSDGCLCLDL